MSEHVPMRLHVGVAVHATEAAVVLAEHRLVAPSDPSEHPQRVYDTLVHAILRPTADIDPVADLLAELADEYWIEAPRFMVMPDALGSGLADTLRTERRLTRSSSHASLMREAGRLAFDGRMHLYPSRGKDQQRLLDKLGTYRRLGQLRFADGLKHQAAMDRALATYDREARDERYIPALIGALAVTLWNRNTGGDPRVLGRDGTIFASLDAARTSGRAVYT
jgi:hypothetical protein